MTIPLLYQCRASFSPQEFTTLIIEPALCNLTEIPFSRAATELLLGTALHESAGLKHRRQLQNGPARSFFQMEPATHNDIYTNFLAYNASLKTQVESFLCSPTSNKIFELEYNDTYAAVMARVHYFRASGSLPAAGDLAGQASYWKRTYNTVLGAGTPQKYMSDWRTYQGGAVTFRSSCN